MAASTVTVGAEATAFKRAGSLTHSLTHVATQSPSYLLTKVTAEAEAKASKLAADADKTAEGSLRQAEGKANKLEAEAARLT